MNTDTKTNPNLAVELEQAKSRILALELHDKKRDAEFEDYKRETQDKLRQIEGWAKNASFNNR